MLYVESVAIKYTALNLSRIRLLPQVCNPFCLACHMQSMKKD